MKLSLDLLHQAVLNAPLKRCYWLAGDEPWQLKEAQEVLSSLKKILETKGVTAVAGRTPTCEVCIRFIK